MSTTLANKWIEIFRAGTQIDSEGRTHEISNDFLEAVVTHYDPATLHESPAVIGHPANNAPAYAWANKLRVRDGILEAQFSDVDSDFEQLVREGKFKKRSASFYLDPKSAPGQRAPYLRHIGFLGAQPPAIKGLRDIKFSEGESLTFESVINFTEDQTMDKEQEQQSLVAKIIEGIKSLLPKKDEAATPANFNETDLTTKITNAVKAATADFGEQLATLKNENQQLRERVDQATSNTTRTELASFVEGLGQAKMPPALRPGLVEFMEAISGVETKVAVITFSEEAGKRIKTKTESKPLDWFKSFVSQLGPFIQFGESFGGLHPKGDDLGAVDPAELENLRKGAGLPAKEGK